MAKKSTVPATKFQYLVRAKGGHVAADGTLTMDPRAAPHLWDDEAAAAKVAKTFGGIVATKQVLRDAGPTPSLGVTLAIAGPTPTKSKPVKPAPAPKPAKGPAHEEVAELLKGTGLPVQEKSSTHYGDPKGPRLVLPRAKAVTRVYLYKMADATTLLGYKTPDQRKAEGLGAVTHVADVTTIEQVRVLVAAVCEANGIQLRQDGRPKAKASRKRKQTPSTGVPSDVGEAGTAPVDEVQASDLGDSDDTTEAQ